MAFHFAAVQAYDRDELMRQAFEGVGSLPMGTIRRHRARKQAEVCLYPYASGVARRRLCRV